MQFENDVVTTIKDVNPLDSFDGKCPFCESENLTIRSSRKRIVPDLGTTVEKVIAKIKEPRMKCSKCKEEFVVHHPFYPPKYEYSRAIVEYALNHFHYMNTSGKDISLTLSRLHQVDVPEDTISTWLHKLSPAFLKSKLDTSPESTFKHIKTISIDGSHITTGKATIGKKKHVDSLSVTKLKNGDYLLMWWE